MGRVCSRRVNVTVPAAARKVPARALPSWARNGGEMTVLALIAILTDKEWYPRSAYMTESVHNYMNERFCSVGKPRVPLLSGQNRDKRQGG